MSCPGPRTSESVVVDSGDDGVMAGVSGTLDAPVAADRRSDSVPYPKGPSPLSRAAEPVFATGLCGKQPTVTVIATCRQIGCTTVEKGGLILTASWTLAVSGCCDGSLAIFHSLGGCRAARIQGNVALDVHRRIMCSSNCGPLYAGVMTRYVSRETPYYADWQGPPMRCANRSSTGPTRARQPWMDSENVAEHREESTGDYEVKVPTREGSAAPSHSLAQPQGTDSPAA